MNRITRQSWRIGIAAALALAAGLAHAHPGHTASGFVDGLAHPLALDHLLVAIAVGVWSAAALPPSQAWFGPAVFLGGLVAGAGLCAWGFELPFTEAGIAVSVLVLGLMLMLAAAPAKSSGIGLAAIALAALWHGSAHAAEAPSAALAAYACGLLAATGALHALGTGAGFAALRVCRTAARRATLLAGSAMAGTGVWLLLQ
jgi:urease accessory protein